MQEFMTPDPVLIIGRRRYWRRRQIREAVALAAGEPMPPTQRDDEELVQAREVRRLLGGVSDMFLWRHARRGSESSAA